MNKSKLCVGDMVWTARKCSFLWRMFDVMKGEVTAKKGLYVWVEGICFSRSQIYLSFNDFIKALKKRLK